MLSINPADPICWEPKREVIKALARRIVHRKLQKSVDEFTFFLGVKRCSETGKLEVVGFGDGLKKSRVEESDLSEPLKDYEVIVLESRGQESSCRIRINGIDYVFDPCPF